MVAAPLARREGTAGAAARPQARFHGAGGPVDRASRRDDRSARRALGGGRRTLPAGRGRDAVRGGRAKARRARGLDLALLRALAPPPYRARRLTPRYESGAGR